MQVGNLFELNFILEHKKLPENLKLQIIDGVEKELPRSQSNEIEVIRENMATVYLNIETLLALHNWLNLKVQELQDSKLVEVKND